MPATHEATTCAAGRQQKSGLHGRSSKEANKEGSQSGKAMQGAAPLCGTSKEMSRQTEEGRLQGYVPLWLTPAVHSGFQNPPRTIATRAQTSKVVVNNSDMVVRMARCLRLLATQLRRNSGIAVQTLGAEVLILSRVLLFDNFQFVEQSLIADLKNLRRLAAVPAGLGQYPFDRLALGIHRRFFADFQQ